MTSAAAIGFGVLVLAVVGLLVWRVLVFRRPAVPRNTHLLALQAWLDGDLATAAGLLEDVIRDDPNTLDPYLQLGDLKRQMGDPGRAAALHRGLTVRPDLDTDKKVQVGLSLAEDLLELTRFDEAGQVLDSLVRHGSGTTRYWRSRFRQWFGLGNLPEAARALKAARTRVPVQDRPWFEAGYLAFQLDRALAHSLAGQGGEARARLRDVEKIEGARERHSLVKAILAAAEGDARAALDEAATNLLDSPASFAQLLPHLQSVLLDQGQYARCIPILERACQGEGAPAALTVDLALLYEKIGERDKALQLLARKKGSEDLTPDAAAPVLRLLAASSSDTDFKAVWDALAVPSGPSAWRCRSCGHLSERLRWFCSRCRSFDSYCAEAKSGKEDGHA